MPDKQSKKIGGKKNEKKTLLAIPVTKKGKPSIKADARSSAKSVRIAESVKDLEGEEEKEEKEIDEEEEEVQEAKEEEEAEEEVIDDDIVYEDLEFADFDEDEDEDEELIPVTSELQNISARFPALSEPPDKFSVADFPSSYQGNNEREKTFLSYAENFRVQYVHLYPNRRPLFLCPVNELGIEKFVCTTIRPVSLRFGELYEWSGAAKFVADFMRYIPLSPPYDLPSKLYSPTTSLALRKGHCFEYATLLTSLLLGVGYDAYVVSGYAVKEICLKDESYDLCPFLIPTFEVPPPKPEVAGRKYTVRQPKDLTSKYEMWMESRRLKAIADEEERKQKEEDDRILLSELPPTDLLRGWRVHSWVLVLDGKREIGTPFFIDPLTGIAHPVVSSQFLGIESIWNQYNYWINMQDCSQGLGSLVYDLTDWTLWEYLIPSNAKESIHVKVEKEEDIGCSEDVQKKADHVERHLDLPPPWVKGICLSYNDFEQRYPSGMKITFYKKAKVEEFAPYFYADGLVRRISIFQDVLLKKPLQVKEFYSKRADKLTQKIIDFSTGWIHKYFGPGRLRHLKEYHCKAVGKVLYVERTMIFYHEARFDCLERRVETPLEMTEYFIGRDDFLNYCYAKYKGNLLKFGHIDTGPRPVEKLVVRYDRNPSKPASDDVKEIIYNMSESRDIISYHYEDDKITYSTREFLKPHPDDIKGSLVYWNPDNYSTYQVLPSRTDKKKYQIYLTLLELMHSEEACLDHMIESQRDVRDLLNELLNESIKCSLEVEVHDIARNDKAQKHRKKLEQRKMEEEMAKREVVPDFLAPFLPQLLNEEQLSGLEESVKPLSPSLSSQHLAKGHAARKKQVTTVTSSERELIPTAKRAQLLRQLCLADFKRRMVDMANLMQAHLEKETDDLQRKQNWYQQNQISLQKADELEYLAYCCDAMLRIRVLEARLNRHKERTPLRYLAMDQKICSDPRLAQFLK